MKIERWDTKEIIFELECGTWKDLIESAITAKVSLYKADLMSADLRSANLMSADLRSANLMSADLRYANLMSADLRSANLMSADLRSANLMSANLMSADLRSAVGNLKEVKSIQLDTYLISFEFTDNKLNIGCQTHTFEEWKDFTDEEIEEMDVNALIWWKKWKDFIFQAIELSRD